MSDELVPNSSTVCEICEDFFSVKVQHDRLLLRVCPQREVTERITLLKKNIAVNPERVQELVEKGGVKPETLKRRAKALEDLSNFLTAKPQAVPA